MKKKSNSRRGRYRKTNRGKEILISVLGIAFLIALIAGAAFCGVFAVKQMKKDGEQVQSLESSHEVIPESIPTEQTEIDHQESLNRKDSAIICDYPEGIKLMNPFLEFFV